MRLYPSKWYQNGSRKKKKIEKALVLIKMKKDLKCNGSALAWEKQEHKKPNSVLKRGAQQINLPLANNQSVLFGESSSRGY